jgi:hypothetical protein
VTRRAWSLALAASLGAAPAAAQAPGLIAAGAVVVTAGMTITSLRDLAFGSVPRGVPTTVPPVAANAGAWRAAGSGNAFVSITSTLPTTLRNTQAVPGVTLPIGLDATSARWRRANSDPAGATPFSPAAGTTGRFGPPPNPTLYIGIGGTVTPSAAQLPVIDTGTLIVQLAYL